MKKKKQIFLIDTLKKQQELIPCKRTGLIKGLVFSEGKNHLKSNSIFTMKTK